MTIRRVGTWANACKRDYPQVEEWVHVAVIDWLLEIGISPANIRYECWIGPSARPDVVVVTEKAVLVVEVKTEPRLAQSTARRQTRRYLETARLRWPDKRVEAWLVWGSPTDHSDLSYQPIQ